MPVIPYRVQEADLLIPTDWMDQSLTVFKLTGALEVQGASFVLSRDAGKGRRPFTEYIGQQLLQCRAALPGFRLKQERRFEFQGHAAAWLDYAWKKDSAELHIRQVFFDRGAQALICTLTTSEDGLQHHEAAWRRVMGTMRLQPLPAPLQEDGPPFPPAEPA